MLGRVPTGRMSQSATVRVTVTASGVRNIDFSTQRHRGSLGRRKKVSLAGTGTVHTTPWFS